MTKTLPIANSATDTDDAADDTDWSISAVAADAEVSLRSVRAACDAGRLDVIHRAPTRISDKSAKRFIAEARSVKLEEIRLLVGADLLATHMRPWQIAAEFGVAEAVILNAVARCKLPCVAHGLWIFVSRVDAAAFFIAHHAKTGRAAA